MTRTMTRVVYGLLLFLSGCDGSYRMVEGPEHIPTKIEVGKPAAGDLIIGSPTTLPDSHYALIPVTLEHLKAWFEPDPYYGYSASDYRRYDFDLNYYNPYTRLHQELMVVSYRIHWHNVIFHNQQDHTTHTLLDRPAVVSRYQVIGQPPRDKDEKYRIDCLLFSISDKDTNRDGVIDANDQIVVYACDIDGSNLRRIAPEGAMILNIKYEPDLRLMYLSTISDTNHDGKYTTHDKKSLLRYRIGDDGLGQPVVEDKVTSEIKSILNAE